MTSLFHRHNWVPYAAKEVQPEGGMIAAMSSSAPPVTYVLWRCECMALRSETLTGPFAVDINELAEAYRAL